MGFLRGDLARLGLGQPLPPPFYLIEDHDPSLVD
jgi:hypothetical protein